MISTGRLVGSDRSSPAAADLEGGGGGVEGAVALRGDGAMIVCARGILTWIVSVLAVATGAEP